MNDTVDKSGGTISVGPGLSHGYISRRAAVGSKVWYYPSKSDKLGPVPMTVAQGQPLDATVIAVWGHSVVNVLVTDTVGRQFSVLSCTVKHPEEVFPRDVDGEIVGRYCVWPELQQQYEH